MKITNQQAVNFVNAVNGTMKEKCLPVRIAFAIKQNVSTIMKNPIEPYTEMYNELIKKYDGVENGQLKFIEELNALLAEETDVAIKKIHVSEFEKLDTDPAYGKLTMAELEALGFMIEE